MHVLIDESGNLGLPEKGGSTKHFIITAVCFPKQHGAQRVITALQKKFRKTKTQIDKLHAYHATQKERITVLKQLQKADMYVYAISLNKNTLQHTDNINSVYARLVKQLLVQMVQNSSIQSLTFSQWGTNQHHRQQLMTAAYEVVGDATIHITHAKKDLRLHLPDFVSWSLFREMESQDTLYKEIIAESIKKIIQAKTPRG